MDRPKIISTMYCQSEIVLISMTGKRTALPTMIKKVS